MEDETKIEDETRMEEMGYIYPPLIKIPYDKLTRFMICIGLIVLIGFMSVNLYIMIQMSNSMKSLGSHIGNIFSNQTRTEETFDKLVGIIDYICANLIDCTT